MVKEDSAVLLRMRGVRKQFGAHVIFEHLNLDVGAGEFVAITGESGSGKSTFLNLVSGIERADQGEIQVAGFDAGRMSGRAYTMFLRRELAFLFQNFALIEDQTVHDNLKIAQRYVQGSAAQKRESEAKALEYVGLGGFQKRMVYELSGGEQQRVAIARLLLKPCRLILADEPTGSLDRENAGVVMGMLKELQRQGKTLIMVTHDGGIMAYADRKLYLRDKRFYEG